MPEGCHLRAQLLPPHEPPPSAGKPTVMFSDLVGSTALSARMDVEDLREVIPRLWIASSPVRNTTKVIFIVLR